MIDRISRRALLRNTALVTGGIAASSLAAPFIRTARAADTVKLRMQNWFGDADMSAWQIGLDMVKQSHPNIEVALEFVPYDETVTRTLVGATAGDLPDVIMCSTDHTPSLATAGVLAPLNDWIAKDPTANPDDFHPGVAQGFKMWDRWWGFPYDVSTWAIYYNKDMFKAAGLPTPPQKGETPWTLDQFVDAAKKLTLDGGKQWGVAWDNPLWDNYPTSNFIYSAGGRNFDDALRHCVVHSPEAAAGIQFIVDLIHKHKVAPTPQETSGGNVNYFQSGLSAMYMAGQWALGDTTKNVDFSFDVTYLPLGRLKRGVTGGSGFAVSATTKHAEEAWEFVRAYTSTEVLAKMIGATGRGIPARRSAAQSYIDSASTPNAAIFVEQLAYSFNDRSVLGFPQYLDAFNRALEPIYNTGEGSVLDALATVEDATNKVLDQQWANVKIKI
jgi:multiple sugar transport system substrate-binding protein